MSRQELKSELSAYSHSQLKIVARKLKLDNYKRTSKVDLINRVLNERTGSQVAKAMSISRWDHINSHLSLWFSIIGVVLTVLFGLGYLKGRNVGVVPPQLSSGSSPQLQTDRAPSSTPKPDASSPPPNLPDRGSPAPHVLKNSNRNRQADVYITRAQALYNAAEYEQAKVMCVRALRINPRDSRALILKRQIEKTQRILRSGYDRVLVRNRNEI